jgi:uncharacterized protein YbjT (DUF2867 family)
MILVAGASGMVGGEVCRLLRAEGRAVRALARRTTDEGKVRELQRLGVDVVVGDVRDRASLDRACRGAHAVVSAVATFQSQDPSNTIRTVEHEGQINLIDAARANGVEHFIPSTYGIRPSRVMRECPLIDAKAAAEQHLIASGIPYTILYTSLFMETWLSPILGFDALNARARIYGSGKNPISWISFRNVAEVIVACIANGPFRNRILELGGSEALAPVEVVRIFEEEGGRKFEVEYVPEEALAAMEAGAQNALEKTIAVLLQVYAGGHVVDMSALRDELPVRWTSVRHYARTVYGLATDSIPAVAPLTG